tara:strand:+ start:1072 stop:1314 length:243 start_codon:yes stop_codon:yes gene_type:complete
MSKPKINIMGMPVALLDDIILYLESGQGDLEYIEAIAKDLRNVREQYQDKINKEKELIQSKPKEEERIISANPLSAEHIE